MLKVNKYHKKKNQKKFLKRERTEIGQIDEHEVFCESVLLLIIDCNEIYGE